MTMKHLTGVFLFLVFAALACPSAGADASNVYQYCIKEGTKAFEKQQDDDAARYFKWAQQIDPSSKEPARYIELIANRKKSLPAQVSMERVTLPYFEEMLRKGKEALARKDLETARQSLNTARLIDPEDPRLLESWAQLERLQGAPVATVQIRQDTAVVPEKTAVRKEPVLPKSPEPVNVKTTPAKATAVKIAPAKAAPAKVVAQTPVPVSEKPKTSVAFAKKAVPDVITLNDIMNAAQGSRAVVKIEMGSSVIIEGKSIDKFLIVDEGVVNIKKITRDQIQVDTLRWGSTFVHIWDESTGAPARSTVYIDVIVPRADVGVPRIDTGVDHSVPFRFRYSNDWSSYHYGPSIDGLERRDHPSYQQSVGTVGETPYGLLDGSATMTGYHPITEVTSYTVGLTGIPVEGTKDLNIRLFDINRRLSPLTLPGTALFGGYVDVNLLDENLGLALTRGQKRSTFGYILGSGSGKEDFYIDAAKITLFPKDKNRQYAFNYAQGSGPDRDDALTKRVYSVEGWQVIDQMRLNAEIAKDEKTTAALAGSKWGFGRGTMSLNLRDINKEFTTVTGYPSNQGEVGALWAMQVPVGKAQTDASLDVYRDRLSLNPDDPNAFNYDANARVDIELDEKHSLSTGTYYTHTPADISPRRYFSADMRLHRTLPVWNGRSGSGYIGHVYQSSRYAFSPQSEYDRYGLLTGFNIPLVGNLYYSASYEYSWLEDIETDEDYNPNVFNTGLSYSHQLTKRLHGNFGLTYQNEAGYGGNNSYLSGEDSVEGSASFVYSPVEDVDLFLDSRLRDVWGQRTEDASYHSLDLRMGMRAAWGSPWSWDPQGTIEGVVFKDKNGNGKQDSDDQGMPDIKVKVGDRQAVTDANGWYNAKVRAKRAVVAPDVNGLPVGYTFSTPSSKRVEVRQGLRDRVDFGLTTQSGIFGVVYVDRNDTGRPDPGDTFITRVKLILDGKTSQFTDARGAYFFKKVDAGKHTISIDMATVPLALIPMIKLKTEIDLAEGVTYVFHIPMQQKTPTE